VKYMLIHFAGESAELDPTQVAEVDTALAAWIADTAGRGGNRHGARLRPVSDATTICVRDEGVLIADGPSAQTQGADRRPPRHPTARLGTIELRPLLDE
jgi:hypothetical protein